MTAGNGRGVGTAGSVGTADSVAEIAEIAIGGEIAVDLGVGEQGFDAGRLVAVDRFLRRYVDQGQLPGWSLLISRNGEVAHHSRYGYRDREAGLPIEPDTLFRIYSMTKPVTSVAAMMLYEQGAFDLNDPVSRFIPEFEDVRVYAGGTATNPSTVPAAEPIRIRHLLTHTSGLTYGFNRQHPVDQLYRSAGFDIGGPAGMDLAACCAAWARLPLLFQPGSAWNYSISTDVLGRVVEVLSGQSLEDFFQDRIFGPLGMTDTGFAVSPSQRNRLAALYGPPLARGGTLRRAGADLADGVSFLSGGGGLVGSIGDYHRFTQFLLRGGELDGQRLLGNRTVGYMVRDHLPAGIDLAEAGKPGQGFGLGFAVLLDPTRSAIIGSRGEFGWGGAASTTFWVDPVEKMTVIFMTQLYPSGTYPLRSQLRQLIYAALVDQIPS